jgi:hypothetical protein
MMEFEMFLLSKLLIPPVFSSDIKIVMHHEAYQNINIWRKSPTVIICQTQTRFDRHDVAYALQLWRIEVEKIIVQESCDYKIEKGKIKIVDGKYIKEDQWGYTKYYYYSETTKEGLEYKEYLGALVQLDRKVNHIGLLIHELGHAFGFLHYDITHDVMNSAPDYWSYYEQ